MAILPPEAEAHYVAIAERDRLFRGTGPLERVRIRELITRHLPSPPATVLDIGGAAGVHAYWLAALGYCVHLIDALPLHIEQARAGSSEFPAVILASAEVGDARRIGWPDASIDAVLLLGPLYHLTDRADRIQALGEVRRVLRPGGIVFAVAVSRFASLLDGLASDLLVDPAFQAIVRQDLANGQHRSPADRDYFTTTFFHHPDELRAEVSEAGFSVLDLLSVRGPVEVVKDFDRWWNDPIRRELLLDAIRAVEREPTLLGMSAHLMAIGRRAA